MVPRLPGMLRKHNFLVLVADRSRSLICSVFTNNQLAIYCTLESQGAWLNYILYTHESQCDCTTQYCDARNQGCLKEDNIKKFVCKTNLKSKQR